MNTEPSVEMPDDDAELAWVSEVLAHAPHEPMPDEVSERILRALTLEQHRRVITDEFDPSASVDEIDKKLAFDVRLEGGDADTQAARGEAATWRSNSSLI